MDAEGLEETSEDDLWFLPGPMEVEPDYLPPGPRAELRETAVIDDWRRAEAGNAARLARVAGRIGALDVVRRLTDDLDVADDCVLHQLAVEEPWVLVTRRREKPRPSGRGGRAQARAASHWLGG